MRQYRLINVRYIDLSGDSDGGCDCTISVLPTNHPLVRFYDASGLKDGIWVKGGYGQQDYQEDVDNADENDEDDDVGALASLTTKGQDLYWEITNAVERGRATTELASLVGLPIFLERAPTIVFETYYKAPCVNFDLAHAIEKLPEEDTTTLLEELKQFDLERECVVDNGARIPHFFPMS